MSKVFFNQSGYIGSSMSERAVEAYSNGEKPRSKWTKAAMIKAISDYCDECGLAFEPAVVSKMRKDDVFDTFLEWSSWHHTGKYARETDFYQLDEEAVCSAFRPLNSCEIEARREARSNIERERQDLASDRQAFREAHGFEFHSIDHFESMHPELVTRRTSSKGNPVIDIILKDGSTVSFEARGSNRTSASASRFAW